jgi:hypothetical protein
VLNAPPSLFRPATAAARERGGADEAVGEPVGVEEGMEVSVEEVIEDHHKR